MKHGPNALIDERLPVVVINTYEEGNRASELRYEKTHSNIVEVKAREGRVVSVLTEGDKMSADASDHVIEIPASSDLLSPILAVIPLQLFGLPHRRPPGLRRGSTAQSRQVGDGE